MRRTLVVSNLLVGALPVAPAGVAREAPDDIGTRPAGAAVVATGERDGPAKPTPGGVLVPEDRGVRADPVVAAAPPEDGYVLDAGLRTHRDTFIGLATLSAAQTRNERFHGVFSLALIRNDAGSHFGLAQLGIGRNLADELAGVAQLGLGENRARHFHGLGQITLGYNRSQAFVGALQLAGYNRAEDGVLEWSPALNMGFDETPTQVGAR